MRSYLKSIRYLLMSIIILLAYDSDMPDKFSEMSSSDYWFIILFTIMMYLGTSTNPKK